MHIRDHWDQEWVVTEAVRSGRAGATLVDIRPVVDPGLAAKGLLAGFTLVVSGTMITAMMIIGLSLEGAL